MPSADANRISTDRNYLTTVQYRDDSNLAARQSIYRFQQPQIDLVATVLDLAGLAGHETVADIGCGNGKYLAALARRGHAGRLLGADLSPGMLAITRAVAPRAAVTVADAERLPLADGVADVMLAPHMLYYVPDRSAAAAEFRRVTRPGGQLLVVLNGTDHLAEFGDLAAGAAAAVGLPDPGIRGEYLTYPSVTLDAGQQLLAEVFDAVERHDFFAHLVLPSAGPVARYIASMPATQAMPDPAAFTAAAVARIPFGADGTFRVTTHPGLLICR
jgi:SAM-dependent methyltransferase